MSLKGIYMEIKYCDSCGQDNMVTAKYCMSCRHQFPDIKVNASKQKSLIKTVPSKKIVVDSEEEVESIDAESVLRHFDDVDMQVDFASLIMQEPGLANKISQKKGVKIEDALASSPNTKRASRKSDISVSSPKAAKEAAKNILESTKYRRGEFQE